MSNQNTYHFHETVSGILNLQNCNVYLHGYTSMVNNYGGPINNYGRVGMCNNYQNGVREKIVYRDRVVEKKVTKRIFIADPGNSGELEKLRAQVEILRKENRKLRRAEGVENGLLKDREIDRLKDAVEDMRRQLSEKNARILFLEDNNNAFLEVNRNQAARIRELEEQGAAMQPDEYEPSRNDIRLITRNIHLFLDEETINYYHI